MAIARDQHGGAKFDAARLFGDAGERDPYVVAEGGNLGAPDRSEAKVFRQERILNGSRAGRQATGLDPVDWARQAATNQRTVDAGVQSRFDGAFAAFTREQLVRFTALTVATSVYRLVG